MNDKKTVLCVDDEIDILELFQDELEDNGFNVLMAGSGNEGIEVFKNNHIDCLISDIRMPNGDGVSLVKNIKEQGKNIPMFLVTGFSDYTSEELAGLGVNAVIFKPFDLEEVVQMVVNTLK
jgi:DNA-binding NtrC family response regulator